jgi:hypothetical protein
MKTKKTKRRPSPPRTWERMQFSHELPNGDRVYGNSLYTCTVTQRDARGMDGELELSIHTHTRNVRHDWREFQRIKTEVAGGEREACELYPAESRLVDRANEYHLWVLPAGERFPWSIDGGARSVSSTYTDEELRQLADRVGTTPEIVQQAFRKSKQRPVPADWEGGR